MTDLFFVDTNVQVYSRDAREPTKQVESAAWRSAPWGSGRGRLGLQVLQERYQVVTRKLSPGMPAIQARAEVRDLNLWRPALINAALLESAFDAEDRWRLSFWDSLIVAAALQQGCRYLLSEELGEERDLDGKQVINPFHAAPSTFGL